MTIDHTHGVMVSVSALILAVAGLIATRMGISESDLLLLETVAGLLALALSALLSVFHKPRVTPDSVQRLAANLQVIGNDVIDALQEHSTLLQQVLQQQPATPTLQAKADNPSQSVK
jgi:hypothetical protein